MATPKVVSGPRCKIGFIPGGGQQNAQPTWVGIYNNVSYGVRYDAVPAYILGRYSAAALDYTAAELVNVTCSGYRVVDHGPYKAGRLPKLQDLIKQDYIVISIVDRVTNKEIMRVTNVLPVGFDTTIAAKQLEEMTLTYVGILHDDEETLAQGGTAEAPGSMDIDQQ
jgi:hypothetical protein